jgi:hypothetical protein
MPQNHRRRSGPLAPELVQLGTANAYGGHLHDDVVRTGVTDLDIPHL